jgi:hypothetical protein
MSDIRGLLAAEAERLQPARAPEFSRLLAVRGRRRYGMAAGAVVLVAAVAGGTTLMAQDVGPQAQDVGPRAQDVGPRAEPGNVRHPAVVAPVAGVPVSGVLQQIGGPAGLGPRKIAGRVHFRSVDGVVTSTGVTADGQFSLSVPPGRYQVTGTPTGHDKAICGADGDVVVSAVGLAGVQVNCHVR